MLQISWSVLFNLGLINIHSGGEYFGSWLGQRLLSGEFWDRSSDEIGHIRFPPHPNSLSPSSLFITLVPTHYDYSFQIGLPRALFYLVVCIKQVARHVFSGSLL